MNSMFLWRRRLWQSILLFMYIYSFHLSFFGIPEEIHTGRIAIIIFIVIALIKRDREFLLTSSKRTRSWRSFQKLIIFHIFLLLYSFFLVFLYGSGEGLHISIYIINMFIVGFTSIWAFTIVFNTAEDFFYALLFATIIQALFVAISLLDPRIALVLDAMFQPDERQDLLRGSYAGGINCIAAPGAIKFSIGLIACFYFVIKNRSFKYYLLYITLSFLCSLIARTGAIFSIVGFVLILVYNTFALRSKRVVLTMLMTLSVLIVCGVYFINSPFFQGIGENVINHFKSLSDEEGVSHWFGQYYASETTEFPPLNLETFFIGTGVIAGISGNGYIVNVDGGFLRLYSALGFLIAAMFYVFLFIQMSKCVSFLRNSIYKYTLCLFFVFLIIGEFKEFTVFAIYYISIFYSAAILFQKEELSNSPINRYHDIHIYK